MKSLVTSWESVDKHTSISHLPLFWRMSDFAVMLDRVQSGRHAVLL
jgi:hypothetical protein